MSAKMWQVTYEDGHKAKVHGAPDEEAARRHAEHPMVGCKNIRDLSEGSHGRATVTELERGK